MGMIAKAVVIEKANHQIVDGGHHPAERFVGDPCVIFVESHTRT